jgi:hypothetical protein
MSLSLTMFAILDFDYFVGYNNGRHQDAEDYICFGLIF